MSFYYAYSFTHDCGPGMCEEGDQCLTIAIGDIDGDGNQSIFVRAGQVLDGVLTGGNLQIQNELE